MRSWAGLAALRWVGLFSALTACADEDAGRFGPDGLELPELRRVFGPSLSLATDRVTIAVNESVELALVFHDHDGFEREVSAEADWSSDDPSIAWVHGGTLTGVLPGLTRIQASHDGRTQVVAVAVTTQGLEAIEIMPSTLALARGMSTPLRALGVFREGARREISALVRWASSDEAVVAISRGRAHARELGSVTLQAQLNDIAGSARMDVTGARLLDLEIVRQRERMSVGSTQQLRTLGRFSDASTVDVTDLAVWGSDDGNLAIMDDNGLVSARGIGEVSLWSRYLGHVAHSSIAIDAAD